VTKPVHPGPNRWSLQSPEDDDGELIALGADLEPSTLLAAYARGLFPMRIERGGPIGWWSPQPRGLISLRADGLHVGRSLRRACNRFEILVDTAFDEVIRRCADPSRPNGWIDDEFIAAYTRLHDMGWAHSVEAWTKPESGEPELAGGLYGVAIGGLFAAESKFHHVTDASKVAVVGLVQRLRGGGGLLLDVQWCTDHLASLGATEVPRTEYLRMLTDAVRAPQLTLAVTGGSAGDEHGVEPESDQR
jgi:leucyl/phenylalanyl-tRNA---protein transferase